MSLYRVGSNKSSINNFPNVRPSLDLDFANTKTLDPRISFTRSSGGSYVGADGLIKYAGVNEARFDHDPVTGKSLGLLVEESSTNFYTTSETLTSGRFNFGTRFTDFTTGGPQGGRFTRIVRDTSVPLGVGGELWPYEIGYSNTGLSNGQQFAVTFYARCPNRTLASIKLSNPDAEGEIFNIDTTWRRFTKIFTYGAQNGLTIFRFNRIHSPYNVNGATFDLAALQIENVTSPSSYIPTVASARTRAADVVQITGTNFSSWYRQDEGTLFADASAPKTPTIPRRVVFATDGSNNNRVGIIYNASNFAQAIVSSSGAVVATLTSTVEVTGFVKSAVAYAVDNFRYSANGTAAILDQSGALPIDIIKLSIGSSDGANRINGHIRRLTYWPKRLPNSQLQALTR